MYWLFQKARTHRNQGFSPWSFEKSWTSHGQRYSWQTGEARLFGLYAKSHHWRPNRFKLRRQVTCIVIYANLVTQFSPIIISRYVVQYAASNGGVIVSNDNYRDLDGESPEMREAIRRRLLMFNFAGSLFMLPQDPLGSNGPCLDQFLMFWKSDAAKTLNTMFVISRIYLLTPIELGNCAVAPTFLRNAS